VTREILAAAGQELADLRRGRERLLDLAEADDLARDLASRLRSLAARITQTEAELASATAAKENVLDLRAALSQMTDETAWVLVVGPGWSGSRVSGESFLYETWGCEEHSGGKKVWFEINLSDDPTRPA
jgi:hypothetical protein